MRIAYGTPFLALGVVCSVEVVFEMCFVAMCQFGLVLSVVDASDESRFAYRIIVMLRSAPVNA